MGLQDVNVLRPGHAGVRFRGEMSAIGMYVVTSELSLRLAGHLVRDEFHDLHLKSKSICKSGLCLSDDIRTQARTLLARLLQVCKRCNSCILSPVDLQQAHVLTLLDQQA